MLVRPDFALQLALRTPVALAVLALLLASGANHPAYAATFNVTRFDDPAPGDCVSGDCSLREAILTANESSGADTVKLQAGTYTLTQAIPPDVTIIPNSVGALVIRDDLTIEGKGQTSTIIDGGGLDAVIRASLDDPGSVEISDVTVRNGNFATDSAGYSMTVGGGIYNSPSTKLTLKNVLVTNNKALYGAGINNSGELILEDSTVSGNSISVPSTYYGYRDGGGINTTGTLTLENSTVSGNTATAGGGINGGGSASLENSTVSMNKSTGGGTHGWGGGIAFTGTLTLKNSSVFGNQSESAGDCGGISHSGGTLTIDSSTIHGNSAGYRGGICSSSANIYNSIVSGNNSQLSGGAIHGKNITLDMTTVSGNLGIAIYHLGGTLTIKNSTVSGNKRDGPEDAAIYSYDGTATLTNVTISENEYDGIKVSGTLSGSASPDLTASNVTVSDNDGYGLVNIWPVSHNGKMTIGNTIVANNATGDCNTADATAPAVFSAGYNLIEDLTNPNPYGAMCVIGGDSTGNIIGSDPVLGALGDNGGATETHALLAGSPAIDAGENASCQSKDQRGAPRPVDGDSDGTATCDIGAYEANANAPSPPPPPPDPPTTTSLTIPGSAGDTEIDVLSPEGFGVGDDIVINPGGDNEELKTIAGFGSMILTTALQFDHEGGEPVALAAQAGGPPVADANGPYAAECQGLLTSVPVDGTGSSDPDPGDVLSFAWTTTCPGGSFDDPISAMPVLTVDTPAVCELACDVELTATDSGGEWDADTTTVAIVDTEPPEVTCPADVVIECDASTDPSHTGYGSVTDLCDPGAALAASDSVAAGACPQESAITRTWTATDGCGLAASCDQTIDVVDTTAPEIDCNAPATITPRDVPVSFTAAAVDDCASSASVEILAYDCFKYTKKGKRVDKKESCEVAIEGDTITILDSGGVRDRITWTVRASDDCGNVRERQCEVDVIKPGRRRR